MWAHYRMTQKAPASDLWSINRRTNMNVNMNIPIASSCRNLEATAQVIPSH